MNTPRRRIGPVGTACRVFVALGLLYLAVTNGGELLDVTLPNGPLAWGLRWYEAALGLVVLPGVMIVAGLAARRFAGGSVHLTGPLGLTVNTAVIVALLGKPLHRQRSRTLLRHNAPRGRLAGPARLRSNRPVQPDPGS
jgi:hypothetical protein